MSGEQVGFVRILPQSEWPSNLANMGRLIHLPLLNFLLGFPIQLLGLVLLPYLSVKYFVEGDNISKDASKALVGLLPIALLPAGIRRKDLTILILAGHSRKEAARF